MKLHTEPDDPEAVAFAMFADVYPHEAYAQDPARFLDYAKQRCPHRTEKELLALLEETARP